MGRKGNDPNNPTAEALKRQKELESLGVPSVLTQGAAQLTYDTTQAQNALKKQSNDTHSTPDSHS